MKTLSWKQWTLVALVFIVSTALPACFRQWKQVDTPAYFVDRGVDPSLSLADVPVAQAGVDAQYQFAMDQWDQAEQIAEDQILWIEGAVDVLKDPATLASIGLNPAGGALNAALLLGGLLMPTPGHAKSKRKSYNKGAEDALKAIEVGKTIAETSSQ